MLNSKFLSLLLSILFIVVLSGCEIDRPEDGTGDISRVVPPPASPSEQEFTPPSAQVQPTAEPTGQPTEPAPTAPVAQPTEEATGLPAQETPTEPATQPTEEVITEHVEELPTEPSAPPTAEPTTPPVPPPTVEPTAQPVTPPTEEAPSEPSAPPTVEPTTQPAAPPAAEAPAVEPQAAPAQVAPVVPAPVVDGEIVGKKHKPRVKIPPNATFGFCYRVKHKEDIHKVAYKFDTTPFAINVINDLYPPNYIYANFILFIPEYFGSGPNVYVVQRGDTIEKIAKKCRLDVDHIAHVNKLKKPYRLEKGDKLIIPIPSFPNPHRFEYPLETTDMPIYPFPGWSYADPQRYPYPKPQMYR